MSLINFPILYIPSPDQGRPLFGGQIYVGIEDLDPQIPANQKQLNVIQEDGTVAPVTQPFLLSTGGVPVYNGNPVRLDVTGNYSIKILSKLGAQVYYIENVFEGEPVTEATLPALLISDISQAYDVNSLAEMEAITDLMPVGKVINVININAKYKVLSGVGTVNGFNIRASDTLSQSYDLVVTDKLPLSHIGCSSLVSDNSPAINYAFANFKTTKVDGDYEIENPVTLTGTGKVVYGLGMGRIWSNADINLILLDNVFTNYINNFILENTLSENSSTAIQTPVGKYMSNGIIDTVIVRGCAQGFSIEGKDNSFNDFNFTLGALPTQTITRPATGRDMKNIISNCTIENTLKSTKLGSGGNPAIFLRGSFNIVHGNRIRNWLGPGILGGDDSIIDNNTVINMADENGIYVSGANRVIVTNNHIENFTADGIAFNSSEHCIAANNYIGGGGNSCVRLQDGCDGINVENNRMVVDGTHAIRIFMNTGLDAPSNVSINNNNIKCNNQAVGNLIVGGPANVGFGKYKNINISNNIIDNYDGSLLNTAFFGPYGLVNFIDVSFADSDEISFSNNQVRMADVTTDLTGRFATLFGVSTKNNRFVFSGGDIYDGKNTAGQNRFSLGSAGAVDSPNVTGLITSVVKEAGTGVYTINTSEVIKIDAFTWNASGANAPFFVRKNVTSGVSSASYSDAFTITMYNLAGTAVNPNFNAAIELNITRQNERNYV